jgi:kynureninase
LANVSLFRASVYLAPSLKTRSLLESLTYAPSRAFAQQLDQADPLAAYRQQFHLPVQANGQPYLYFTGNSLGCQPKAVRGYLDQELQDWARLGVEGHVHAQHPWLPYHEFLAEASARIVGAKPEEVVMMNSLTVNLHLMMVSFYQPTAQRYRILIEADAFPSDHYAVASQLQWHGHTVDDGLVALKPRPGEHTLRQEDILAAIAEQGDHLALVLLGGVNYYTGQFFDLASIAAATHAVGAVMATDLAHAVGNVPLKLHEWGIDFACWCSYKYLNGGPGGVGGCYLHERHIARTDLPRLAGWWGHDKASRFQMDSTFRPIPTAEGWQLSNAPILSMAALRASLDLFEAVGMDALRAKSLRLTGYLAYLLGERLSPEALTVITPSDPTQRGCQLSLLTGPQGRSWFEALTAQGVICDWREPNVIRVAPTPLYNRFEEVWQFVEILAAAGE